MKILNMPHRFVVKTQGPGIYIAMFCYMVCCPFPMVLALHTFLSSFSTISHTPVFTWKSLESWIWSEESQIEAYNIHPGRWSIPTFYSPHFLWHHQELMETYGHPCPTLALKGNFLPREATEESRECYVDEDMHKASHIHTISNRNIPEHSTYILNQ